MFSILLLVRIDAVASPIQLHEAQFLRCEVPLRSHDDERDFDVADVRSRIAGAGILAKHRARGSVTSVLEDGLSNSAWKHPRIGGLELTDPHGPGIVHYVRHVREHDARDVSGCHWVNPYCLSHRAALESSTH